MSPDVARFLLELVDRQTLAAAAPDLVETARLVVRARAELVAVMESGEVSGPSVARGI